jgi:UDP-glucose 4-epimerase
MKVLITGGAGYIGTELTKALSLLPSINEIVVYDNLWKDNYNLFTHSGIVRGKVKFVKAEILDSRQLKKALEGVDVVYHLAAHVDSKLINANHHLYEQINNWGTAELSYAIEESNVKRLINASTIAVYGNLEDTISDVQIAYPKTYYGSSKLRGEEHLLRLSDKLDVYNLRIGNVYGYGSSMRMDTVVNQFVFSAAFQNRIKILGEGNQKRPFIHIDSLSEILVGLINDKLDTGTYNVVENSYSVLDIADTLKEIIPEMEMLFVNQHLKLRNIDVDTNKIINQLIKEDRTNMKRMLEQFFERFYHSK